MDMRKERGERTGPRRSYCEKGYWLAGAITIWHRQLFCLPQENPFLYLPGF